MNEPSMMETKTVEYDTKTFLLSMVIFIITPIGIVFIIKGKKELLII